MKKVFFYFMTVFQFVGFVVNSAIAFSNTPYDLGRLSFGLLLFMSACGFIVLVKLEDLK